MIEQPQIIHHAAVDCVTDSCHRLRLQDGDAVLAACGLREDAATSNDGFPIETGRALLVTQVHSDCGDLSTPCTCIGGRIVNDLKAILFDPRHDVLLCGCQAACTPGRDVLQYAPNPGETGNFGETGGYLVMAGQRVDIHASVHQIGGYSAHADQKDLLNFVSRIPKAQRQVRIVHGDDGAKSLLAGRVRALNPSFAVVIPGSIEFTSLLEQSF